MQIGDGDALYNMGVQMHDMLKVIIALMEALKCIFPSFWKIMTDGLDQPDHFQ